MRILPRYVLLELGKVFFVTLTALTLFFLIGGVILEARNQGLGPAQVLRLIPFILPDALRFTVPATILFAVANVYGGMSGSNEVVAIKSLGISPMVLLWPALVAAFVLSLATVWLNDLAVSWGRRGVERVVLEGIEQIAYGMLRTQRSFSASGFSIIVKRVEGRRLIEPTLTFQASKDRPGLTIKAREAEMRTDLGANELKIIFDDFTVYSGDEASVHHPGKREFRISLEEMKQGGDRSRHPSNLAMRELASEVESHRRTLEELEQEMAADGAFQLLSADFHGLTAREWEPQVNLLAAYQEHLHRLFTEPYRRWANGFSCLCFAMVGAPMAIRLRNAHFLNSFFACFLPILVVYYPLLAYGVGAAKSGDLPPYCVWLGNVILALWGVWLVRRVIRY